MDNQTAGNAAANAYAQNNAYADNNAHANNNAHKSHNAYKNDDPYKRDDPYKKGSDIQQERKKPWALDFELVRFFRENYNAGIDFEESPRAFFDEEYMLAIRIRLLARNFITMITKLLFMILFSAVALVLPFKGVLILGFIYLIMFLYFVAVPIAFVKYTRQYIIDDTPKGKLKKVHATYAKWLQPLETFTMNTLTIIFVFIEFIMLLNTNALYEYIRMAGAYTKMSPVIKHIESLSISDIQASILTTIGFYLFAYFVYWIFIYKLWSPRWEVRRQENEKAFTRTNQRTAKNLKDELTKEEV
ncbi:MAG: hypothetical protein WC656_01885 [Sulfurimonas sp.]|jgi:hypothetical protein